MLMTVTVVKTVEDVRHAVTAARSRGLSVGLVPTMGALHAGHVSLLRAARQETGFVVVSIFVNPTQFGPGEDLTRYPRQLEKDIETCAREGADVVFAPAETTIYPPGFRTFVEVVELEDVLCGPSRPGHFRGVATVVLKLFHIVEPDIAYFGQKDAQQARIIQQMVRDLDLTIGLRICPIVREPDGLALSSRNRHLNVAQRRQATVLYQALEDARQRIEAGERDAVRLRQGLASRIQAATEALLDYAEVVDADTLQPTNKLHGDVLIAVAAKFGDTRLIDNIVLHGIT
jgi:pantoate--beta-alanine ligase